MARSASTQPTEVELQILRILWELGPSSARVIHNRLSESKETGYSTTVKMLAVMLEKELVTRDDSVRPQLFEAATSQEKTQKQVLSDMIHKLYDGSAKSLLLQALSSTKASKRDLTEIRKLLERLEE